MSDSEDLESERVSVEDASGISRGEFLKLAVAAVVGSLSVFFGAVGCAGAGDGGDEEGTDGGEEDGGGGGGY